MGFVDEVIWGVVFGGRREKEGVGFGCVWGWKGRLRGLELSVLFVVWCVVLDVKRV